MSGKEIEIIIGTDGTVSVDMIGYQGNGCSEEAGKIIDALGTALKSNKKNEYYQKKKNEVKQNKY